MTLLLPHHHSYKEQDKNFLKVDEDPIKIHRSSSLKTVGQFNNTSPNSGNKKLVRFADCLGLDLADVKLYLLEEVPLVPLGAFKHLKLPPQSPPEATVVEPPPPPTYHLHPTFPLPPPNHTPILLPPTHQVLLSSCQVINDPLTVIGTVLVRNLDYHKKVFIRYTKDNWVHSEEIECTYQQKNSLGNLLDTFTFAIPLETTELSSPKFSFSFAIRFNCLNEEWWDNNRGGNYSFVAVRGCDYTTTKDVENMSPRVLHEDGNLSLFFGY